MIIQQSLDYVEGERVVAHLRDDKLPGDQQRPQQVVSPIISHFIDRYLADTTRSQRPY